VKAKITSKQVTYAAALFIIATSLLTKPLYTFTKNGAWIAVIAGYLAAAAVYLIYAALTHKFPGMSVVEVNDAVYGAVIGKIISALYIFFFFTLTCFDTNIISNFIKGFILPGTPMVLITAFFLIVCVWAVRKGPVNIMKYGALLVFVSVALVLLNSLMLIKDSDPKNLLPVFGLPLTDYVIGTHSVALIPLCDPFLLVMFLPDMLRPKEFGKAMVKGLTIGAAFLLFIVVRDIAVLGEMTAVSSFPTLMSIRLINVGDVVTRMDIVYVSLLVSLMFFKIAALYYASVSGFQRLMKFDSFRFLTYIFGALLLLYSMTVFRSSDEHFEWLINGAAEIFQTFFLILLPLLTLIVAAFRGFFKEGSSAPGGEQA
jgi:spore germination protein KB